MQRIWAMSDEQALTISVPEAGKKYLNLGRNASYAAAERGEIPTIKVGRLLRVPVRAMERLLDNVAGQAA
jgi:excisionase family DNA binding protein